MTHYQLVIPREMSWEVVNYLGSIERVHFEDVSNPTNKPFQSQVKRCEESLTKIGSIIAFMKSKKVGFDEYVPELNPTFVQSLLNEWEAEASDTKTNPSKRLGAIEEQINR